MNKTLKTMGYVVIGILVVLALRFIAYATGLWPFEGL